MFLQLKSRAKELLGEAPAHKRSSLATEFEEPSEVLEMVRVVCGEASTRFSTMNKVYCSEVTRVQSNLADLVCGWAYECV